MCMRGSYENISRFDAALYDTLAVQVSQGLDEGFEHIASFVGRKSPVWQKLGEVFRGMLHYHVEQVHARQLAAAGFKELDQVGMGELGGLFPASELSYAYTPDRAGCVKQIVFAQAGAAEGWGPSLDFALPIIGQRSWREAFPRGVWRRASASSSADGFAPQGAVDGERFSADRGLAWKGGAGATSWEWTGEFPEPRRVGSILAVLGDEAQTLRNWPCDYVWDWSPDGSTWHELEETRVSRERRMFRLQRLREPRTALAIRLRIRTACGESP